MTREVRTMTVCDLHEGEVEATANPSFVVDGRTYTVDVCSEHYDQFSSALAPFREAATTTPARRQRRATQSADTGRRQSYKGVREWAQRNGVPVNASGRVPNAVIAKFEAAQGR